MRIGYDLRPAVKPNSARRGVGRYALEVFKAIRRENPHPQIIPYLIKGRPELNEFRSDGRLLSYLPRPSRMNWMVDWLQLPVQFRRDQLDLFHATDLIVLPVSVKTRIWMTVHDLIPYVFWKETVRRIPRDYVLFLRQAWKQIKRADRIITSSEFSRRDICRRAGIDPRRVSVAYLGCNEELKHVPGPEARSRLESAYGISGPFLFYVGGTDYRKNLPFLLRAFAMIRARGYEGRLVLGGDTFQQEIPEVLKLEELARKLGIEAVYQEQALAPKHPIYRNIFMGRELTSRLGFLSIKKMKQISIRILKEIGFMRDLSPDTPVGNLSGGERQGVAIGRALHFGAKLLILDEPTNALSIKEAEYVLNVIQQIKKRISVVFITHNVHHVYPVADRFVILDRGEKVAEVRKEEVNLDELLQLMREVTRRGG